MLYLLDANTLIRADADYYPLDRIPQFWDWLLSEGRAGRVKVPIEIYEEVSRGRGDLPEWLADSSVQDALVLDEEVEAAYLQAVIEQGYAADLNDAELEQIGADPFLVAYAIPGDGQRVVVTREVSKPKARRQNRKVPDVCTQFGVRWVTDFAFYRELDFRIR